MRSGEFKFENRGAIATQNARHLRLEALRAHFVGEDDVEGHLAIVDAPRGS
jgi:hypothetical protein